MERDFEAVLIDLAEEFALLSALVERRTGGQRSLPMGRGAGMSELASVPGPSAGAPAEAVTETPGGVEPTAEQPAPAGPPAAEVTSPGSAGPRRPTRYGLSIQFEPRADDPEMARLVEATVWINEAHPAYRRAVASRSEGYHIALATAMALAPLAVDPAKEHAFLTAFLTAWGEAIERRGARRRK